jgi:tripartite-type tricarboxylate transporter receptor subunit TctC
MWKQCIAACVAFVAALAGAAAQDAYPTRPIRIVVPYSAGGPADVLARMVGERLRLGQPVTVENKGGAGGHVGAEQVAKGPADGYVLVLTTIAHNGAAKLYGNMGYDPGADLQPVVMLAESPSVLLVHQSVPARDVQELLALIRSKPGQFNYASAGVGSAMHMAAELFRHMAKVQIAHIPYRGGAPAMTDLLAGQVQFLFDSVGTAHQHIATGKVRALAVTSPKRNPSLPDVPTLAEAGLPGYSSVPWYVISAPKGVPQPVVDKLNAEVNAVLKAPDLVQRWASMGIQPLGGSRADAAARNKQETEKWNAVIAAANLKAE